MKTLKAIMVSVLLISLFLFSGCNTYNYGTTESQPVYENPAWAPEYYTGVRYYYLPDIEVYYDLSMRDFIYLNNGRWMYSQSLPSLYSYYDLFSGYVIVLNVNIYRPWMHHQYYVSHYPRYYYRDYYDRSNFPYVRGFNENLKSAIFWKENERDRAREWNDENLNNSRKFKYSSEDRRQQNQFNNESARRKTDDIQTTEGNNTDRNSNTANDNVNRRQQDDNTSVNRDNTGISTRNETGTSETNRNTGTNRTGSTRTDNEVTTQPNRSETTTRQQPNTPVNGSERQTQSTNYYGRTIGTTVKVERQMKNPAAESTQTTTRRSSSTNSTPASNSTNRTEQNSQRR